MKNQLLEHFGITEQKYKKG